MKDLFYTKLYNKITSRTLKITIALQNCYPKPSNKSFLVPNLKGFVFGYNFAILDQFEGVEFKYDNSILKFQSKNTQKKHFWSQS